MRRGEQSVPFCLPEHRYRLGNLSCPPAVLHTHGWERGAAAQLHNHRGSAGRWQYTANLLWWLTQLHNLTGVHLRQMHQEEELPQAMQGRGVTLQVFPRRNRRDLVLPRSALLGCSANDKWGLWGLVIGEAVQTKWIYIQGSPVSSWQFWCCWWPIPVASLSLIFGMKVFSHQMCFQKNAIVSW